MLVLTRKPGQSIIIGDGVEVQVLSVNGDKVRLGISAPKEVPIYRDEVLGKMQEGEPDASGDREAGPGDGGPGASAAVDHALSRLSG